jgi:hypothetical protein
LVYGIIPPEGYQLSPGRLIERVSRLRAEGFVRAMARTLPSRTERLVRAFLLLAISGLLTLAARFLGLYETQDSTRLGITIVAIIIIAVLASRFIAKPLMQLFGWKS